MSISEGGINVPISLSYHSGGIRIPEEAGNVGLGWALNAGGMITRSVEDRDDLKYGRDIMPDTPLDVNGYYDPYQYGAIRSQDDCKFYYNGVLTEFPKPAPQNHNSRKDLIPDTFNFNFNGYSGSFVLTKNKQVHLLEKTDIKIILLSNDTFEAITPDGTKYEFNVTVESSVPLWAESPYAGTVPYISSWYLSKITTSTKEIINFVYDYREDYKPLGTFKSSYKRLIRTSGSSAPEGINPYKITYSAGHSQIETAYLTEIFTNSSKVKFIYSNPGERLDIKSGYTLNKIELYNSVSSVDQFVKKVDFNYSYFGTSKSSLRWPRQGDYSGEIRADNSDSDWGLRLRLDNLIINDTETYSFEYNGNGIDLSFPTKTTMSQDHWGFFNGITNLHSFIPRLQIPTYTTPIPMQKPEFNAKRHAVENKTKAFTLNKVTYPTGGFTEYNHELHTFDNKEHDVRYSEIEKAVFSGNYQIGEGWVEDTIEISNDISTTAVELNYNFYMFKWPGMNNNSIPPVDPAYAEIQILGSPDGTIIEKMTQENANIEVDHNGNPIPGVPVTRNVREEICLPNGVYTIRCHFTSNSQYAGQSKLNLSWANTSLDSQRQYGTGGGLRIKSITDHDTDGSIKLKREFDYHHKKIENGVEVEKSYGILRNPPKYNDTYNQHAFDSRYVDFIHGTQEVGTGGNRATYIFNPVASTNTSLYQDKGSYVGYDQVSISHINTINNGKNGKEIFKFYNKIKNTQGNNGAYGHYRYRFSRIIDPRNGLLKIKESYKLNPDNSFTLVSTMENDYKINDINISDFTDVDVQRNLNYILGGNKICMAEVDYPPGGGELSKGIYCGTSSSNDLYSFQFHPYYSNLVQQTGIKETIFDLNGEHPIVSESRFFFDSANHLQRTKTETIDSEGNIIVSRVHYPDDVTSSSILGEAMTTQEYNAINRLKRTGIESRISQPVQKETLYNGNKSIQRTNFKTWSNNLTLPNFVQTAKNNDGLEDRIVYYDYDNLGNPLEVSKSNGIHIVYIWGYNKEYPIAKIENATYSQVSALVNISGLQSAANADIDHTIGGAGFEGKLRTALNVIRTRMPNAQVSTYTYDPLIGVTSMTDPRGYTVYYDYDDFNRLKQVKDAEGNILNQNDYNYAPQN